MADGIQSGKVRVLIAESSRMSSQLLSEALGRDEQLEVVGATAGGAETLQAVLDLSPAVVLVSEALDDAHDGGIQLVKDLYRGSLGVRFVVLLESNRRETVVEAFKAGAKGVFSRNDALEDLAKCLVRVSQGQVWASSAQLDLLLETVSKATSHHAMIPEHLSSLSKREQEVVHLVVEGHRNREIAERMDLSPHTVKNHIFRIFEKLGVSSRLELMLALSHRFPARTLVRREAGSTDGNGSDVLRDNFITAAEQGIPSAQFVLGQMYLEGQKVPKDRILAYKWLWLAERAKCSLSEASRLSRKKLASEMLAEHIAEAERLASEWMARSAKSAPATSPAAGGDATRALVEKVSHVINLDKLAGSSKRGEDNAHAAYAAKHR